MKAVIMNQCELAVRLIEAAYQLERPDPDPHVVLTNMLLPAPGLSSKQAAEGWLRAAEAALNYFTEALGDNVTVQQVDDHPTRQ